MHNRFREIIVDNSDQIVQLWMEKIENTNSNNRMHIANDMLENTNREFMNVIFISIQNEGSTKDVEVFSEKIINLGWPLSYITDGLQLFRQVTINFILGCSDEKIDTDYISILLTSVDDWVDPIIRQLVDEYTGNWEQIVSLQRVALQEISAPLIPVVNGITIMPLIGTIDTERAKLIMENLLQGTIKHNSQVVLIDITGVPVVDTMVAHHIIQAAEAVHLIGAKCILVGIRPEIAQTIVNLGIDLSEFSTKSSLKKGFTSALEMTNRKIQHIDKNGESEKTKNILDSLKET